MTCVRLNWYFSQGTAAQWHVIIKWMRKSLTLFAALLLITEVAFPGPKPQPGTIVAQTSVACGAKTSKGQDTDLLCQQYVVRSGTTDYTIRQPKPSDQTIIPLNTGPVHARQK